MSNKIKWGIVGTGWVSDQFVADLAHVANGEGYAVGSRTIENATEFATKYQMTRAYGSYEELMQDSEVDAIYVGTPHPFHTENVLAALLDFCKILT